jgi:hypothetical protein
MIEIYGIEGIERGNCNCWKWNGVMIVGEIGVDGGKVIRRFNGVYLDERICILRGIESIDLQLTYILETTK